MTDTPAGTRNLLCFALYSANHAMHRLYRPLLAPLGLTYPQYLVLVSLWARDGQRVGDLGQELGLETNTLTPLLKRMAESGLVARTRSTEDERVVTVSLTDKGRAMEPEAARITACIFEASGLSVDEIRDLRDRVNALRTRIADDA